MFLNEPAIKIELIFENEADLAHIRDHASARLESAGIAMPASGEMLPELLATALGHLAASSNQPLPATTWKNLDAPGHLAFAFGWTNRNAALWEADSLVNLLSGEPDEPWPGAPFLGDAADDCPLWIRDDQRTAKIVAITGTNGKTTTTRLVAHMVMAAGFHAGWSSSSGVYIDGIEVLAGDYSGPSGARRVLEEPEVDIAVLESARGGILLRGLAFEHCDVSVFTNVSADHLGLQGINTLDSLANVKAIVVRATRSGGVAVLNADDTQVIRATRAIQVRKILISQNPGNPIVAAHVAATGEAIVVRDGEFVHLTSEGPEVILAVEAAPVTFGGHAKHMVENALCAAAAALGLGLTTAQVAEGLRSFRNTAEQNRGRLNVFDVSGITVVMDFAHNAAGLAHLLSLARALIDAGARVIAVIGAAGDREASVLREIGKIAGSESDQVIIKKTGKYLRGRTHGEIIELFEKGIHDTSLAPVTLHADSEVEGLELGLSLARQGDAVVIMSHEQMPEVLARLREIGVPR